MARRVGRLRPGAGGSGGGGGGGALRLFAREIGRAALALVALVLGVAATASFFEGAVEESGGVWWMLLIAFGLALAVAAFAMGMVFLLVGSLVAATAEAWAALVGGGGGREGRPGVLAAANLATLGLALWGGAALYRTGVEAVELGWAVQGVLLGLAGVIFGLLPAIPRVVFAIRGGRRTAGAHAPRGAAGGERRRLAGLAGQAGQAGQGAALFVTLATLGVGLSMAVAEVTPPLRFRGAERPIPYGDWARGCVDDDLDGCERSVRLRIVAPRAGVLRVEDLQAHCDVRVQSGEEGAQAAVGADGETRWRDVQVAAGDVLRVAVDAESSSPCTWSVRWRWRP